MCLRLDVFSLTEIPYLQVKPREKGTNANEDGILKTIRYMNKVHFMGITE